MNKVEILDNEDENNLKNVGSRIQKCRKAAGLTQRQLSDITGISENHISRVERGIHIPNFDIMVKIAKALDVSIDVFVEDLSANNINIFLENIKGDVEGMSQNQLSLVKDTSVSIKKYKF